ncbi:MAG: response regulator [Spirochaetales bacterium]|nr:response regulator [Spirochaetales bacterium]
MSLLKSGTESVDKSKMKILIVEDENIVAKDIKGSLKGFGYDVVDIVGTGEEAIRRSEELKPDLVLMDIMLKGKMNGIDVARHIREHVHIPVVFLTAYADEDTLHSAKLSEPFGYIIKPFEDAELHSTIQMAVYRHDMERRLKEREQWLTTILRSISDAVIVTDEEGKVTFMNPVAETLTAYDQSEALGKNVFDIYRIIDDKNLGTTDEMIQDRIKSEMFIQRANQLLVSKQNDIVPVDTTQTNLVDTRDRVSGSVVVIRDITKKLEAEAKTVETLEKLRMAMGGMIQAMAYTVEKRDPYTAGHQRRVADLARTIGTEMKLADDRVDGIRLAGVIHDVGKIAIPSEILSKPGKLTDLEYNLVKKHPEVGFDILRNIDFPWPIADIVMQHHERMDGSGYPRGLKSDDIMLEAKIIAIADVVEAMASHRPYRAALGIEKALDEIETGKGTRYDPEVAAVCLDLFKTKKFDFR